MRSFTMVTPAIWSSPLFKTLGDAERVLFLYFYTGRHQTIAGVSFVPDAYAANDLGWSVEKCGAARSTLISKGAISFDEKTSEVLVEGWWTDNGPANPNHLKGCQKGVAAIASGTLRKKAAEDLEQAWKRREGEKSVSELLGAQRAKYAMGGNR